MKARRLLAPIVAALLALGAAPLRPSGQATEAQPTTRPRHPRELSFEPLRYRPPAPSRSQLPNGLQFWVAEDRTLPLVHGVLVLQAGTMDDPPQAVGLAEVVGDLLRTGGSHTRPAEEVDEEIDFLGASLSVSVEEEFTSVSFSSLSRDSDRMLALVSDLVRNPAFRADRLELARGRLREVIRRRWEDPQDILDLRFLDLIYGPRSRWARRPENASVARIDGPLCRSFHARRVAPNLAWLGLAGDLDAAEARRKVEKVFGIWKTRRGPERRREEARGGVAPGVYWIEREQAQAGVAIGHLGAPRLGPDHYALRVLNLILGSGFSSRLVKEVRTARGLAYGVGGGVSEGYDRGLFRVGLQTQPERAAEAARVVREVLQGMRERPPDAEEMRTAHDREAHSFVFHFSSAEGIVEERVLRTALGYPKDYLDAYLEKIHGVNFEEVRRTARAHIRPERLVTLIVGPEAAVAPLRASGMEVRRLPLEPEGAGEGPAAGSVPVPP